MYESFFGLKERPFQLIPNPEYFFYSNSHKEALAYLNYAVHQGDGFIEISGEVGTGKTVLCRTFIEKMGEDAEIAYIFNPKLDPKQLLQAINDDFGIMPNSTTIKDSVDDLNEFLIRKKSENKKVILIIDEAQNLSKPVLEQLRLLSNLETVTEKLLQIILVGQPELREKLNSYELRQLGQRITLSWTLYPLNFSETKDYILHRIKIASFKSAINISKSVFKQIYSYSKGSPRLINIVCDRILLTAYSLNNHKLTANIAKMSIKDLKGKGEKGEKAFGKYKLTYALLLIVILATFVFWLVKPFSSNKKVIPEKVEMKKIRKKKTPALIPLKKEKKIQFDDLANSLRSIKTSESKSYAIQAAISLWGIKYDEKKINKANLSNEAFLKKIDRKSHLRVLSIGKEDGFELIKRLNLPTIMELSMNKLSGSSKITNMTRFITLYKIDKNILYFVAGINKKTIRTTIGEIEKFWTGKSFIVWKNYFKIENYLLNKTVNDNIITLKMLLIEVGFDNLIISRFFDNDVDNSIKLLQKRNGINVDGIVGPRTKIVLYNELKRLKPPKLIDMSDNR